MPGAFQDFSKCRIVLDCTEVQCLVSRGNMESQKWTYSNYKSRNTLTMLVGVAPNGAVMYVSDMYGGSTSDKQIVEDCIKIA